MNGIPKILQVLAPIIEWNNRRDFLAHLPARLTAQQLSALGVNRGGKLAQDFPFGSRLADLAGNFRTEHDAPLGAGFGAAIVLLVTGLGREENNFIFRCNEHLICQNDVLVHAHGNIGKRAPHVIRLRQGAQKVSSETVEQIQVPARAGLHHFGRGQADPIRHRKSVKPREGRGILCVNWFPSRKSRRVSAHFRASLN